MTQHFSSRSPIDGSTVWEGPESTPDEVAAVMRQAHESWPLWRRTPVTRRIEIVRRFAEILNQRRQEISTLITREVGKLPWEADAEVTAAIAKAELSIQAMQDRRGEQVAVEGAVSRVVRYRPIGVTLVLGPFNFPLHLPGGQIIPLLLAGNTVVFKPSDQATGVAAWTVDAWREAGLPDGVLGSIVGGVAPAVSAIDSAELGGVYLTGGRAAGKAIHRQLAGRPAVLLALELGGNNPLMIVGDPHPQRLADLVTFSAFVTSGQRCTCARRAIFVRGDATQHQIDAVIERTRALRVGLPEDNPAPELGPLISEAAAESLWQTYVRMLELGARPLVPMEQPTTSNSQTKSSAPKNPPQKNLVRPAIVDATGLSTDALTEIGAAEWFGPLLVVERCDRFEDAIDAAARTPYGLAASLIGGNVAMFETFLDRVAAGVVHWNRPTTGAAGVMPFGGLGASGNHRPAGYHAIDFCNDPVASLQAEQLDACDPWSAAMR